MIISRALSVQSIQQYTMDIWLIKNDGSNWRDWPPAGQVNCKRWLADYYQRFTNSFFFCLRRNGKLVEFCQSGPEMFDEITPKRDTGQMNGKNKSWESCQSKSSSKCFKEKTRSSVHRKEDEEGGKDDVVLCWCCKATMMDQQWGGKE